MVKIKIGKKERYYDGYLKSNLDMAKEVVSKDWDMCFIVDGVEGAGKSVLAQQVAAYFDNSLTLDRITFNPTEFRDAIMKAKQYQAVIYDEAYGGLASRQAMSEVNKALVSMMAQIRQKNLFVIIVLPCFFELDKYIGVWRSRALLHVYLKDNFKRGFFSFYNIKKKKDLYMKGKKFYQYLVRPNFRGRFTAGYIVNEKKYRAKKLQALEEPEKPVDQNNKFKFQRNALMKHCIENGMTLRGVSEGISKYCMFGIDKSTIGKTIKDKNAFKRK